MLVDAPRFTRADYKFKKPDLGGTYKPFISVESLFKETIVIAQQSSERIIPSIEVIVKSEESHTLANRRIGSNIAEHIARVRHVAEKTAASVISTGRDIVAKGSARLKGGRRPRGRCPDCGAVYILSLGHSNCRSKKSESNIAIKSFSPVYFKKAA